MTRFWCGNSSKTGARWVAYTDLALAVFYLIFGFFRLTWSSWFLTYDEEYGVSADIFFHFSDTWGFEKSIIVVLLILLFVFTAEVCLICLLMNGISERNPEKCGIWIKIRVFLLIIGITGYIYEMAVVSHREYLSELVIILLLGIMYRIYTVLLVHEFKCELNSYRGYYELGFFSTKS